MNETLITVNDLKVHFPIKRGIFSRTVGYVYAVDGVSFELAKGETLGIVGESGCGKTTLLHLISGLEKTDSGRILAYVGNLARFDLPDRGHWVDVVPAKRSMRATVVASLYPRKLPSTNQIVFVNVGAEQGVEIGNRFYIVRQGDEWRKSAEGSIGREIETTVPLPDPPKHYPWEVVALGRAVNVQPQTTAILLEKAKRAVRMGDRAELRKGE